MSSWWWRDCDCGVRLADCFCTDWEEIRTGLILNGLWASEAVQINDNSIEILHFFWKQVFVLLFHSKNSCQDRAYLVNTDDSEFQCCLWMSPLFNANVNCNGQLSSSMTIPARDIDSNGCIYWPWPMSMSVIKFKRFERMVLAFTSYYNRDLPLNASYLPCSNLPIRGWWSWGKVDLSVSNELWALNFDPAQGHLVRSTRICLLTCVLTCLLITCVC